MDRREMEDLLSNGNIAGLVEGGRGNPAAMLTFLRGRLGSPEPKQKWSAVRALSALAANQQLVNKNQLDELLRRLSRALAAGAATSPRGVPEAMAELLSVRPEFQDKYLSSLAEVLTNDEVKREDEVLLGAIWGVGRLGKSVMAQEPEVLFALDVHAKGHDDEKIRDLAAKALQVLK